MKLQLLTLLLILPLIVQGSPVRRVVKYGDDDSNDELKRKRIERDEVLKDLEESTDETEKVALRGQVARLRGVIKELRRG
jgi:hypothetical protein